MLTHSEPHETITQAPPRETRLTTIPTPCYVLHGVLFVPSYSQPDLYVAPGSRAASRSMLTSLGARPHTESLWPR